MDIYIELTEKEKEIQEKIKLLNAENIDLFKGLDKYAKKYSEEFRVLPRRLDTFDFTKTDIRLQILKDEIELSTISEEEKKEVYDAIEDIRGKIVENLNSLTDCNKELVKNNQKIRKIEAYLQAKKSIIEENEKKINNLNKKVEAYKSIVDNSLIDEDMKVNAKKKITSLEIEIAFIKAENSKILEETKCKKDFVLDEEDAEKEVEVGEKISYDTELVSEEESSELDVSEEEEKDESLDETMPLDVTKFVEDGKESDSEEIGEIPEEDLEEIPEALVKEEPKKVKAIRKASPELIGKLKKGGKIALGVLTIGAALATILINPVASLAFATGGLFGGLILDEAKERILKK